MLPVERARPLLGTYVAVRATAASARQAGRAIDAAFDEIARIDALMSFQRPDSDVARLNREAARRPVCVDRRTAAVLRWARALATASGGGFDVTVAPQLVAGGWLPVPIDAAAPDPSASWRDVVLDADGSVRFRRPLWIDLGGIAKGYAVDRGAAVLRAHGAHGCVNAGGDLRVVGAAVERVALRLDAPHAQDRPVVELRDGALASSGTPSGRAGPHIDPRRGDPVRERRFVCVVAARCVVADALTKVVLARGQRSVSLLRRYGAVAHLHGAHGWRHLGMAA
jgi:thiamine biosynthesis lipoprotein